MKEQKTNAMRILDSLKAAYTVHSYDTTPEDYEPVNGENAIEKVGTPAERVFKTIVTRAKSNTLYVFMLPIIYELDLKKCAAAVGEKSVAPIMLKELLPLTGYIRGGCSPIGMKKKYVTVAHKSALDYDSIVFSAGRVGTMIETSVANLVKAAAVSFDDLIRE